MNRRDEGTPGFVEARDVRAEYAFRGSSFRGRARGWRRRGRARPPRERAGSSDGLLDELRDEPMDSEEEEESNALLEPNMDHPGGPPAPSNRENVPPRAPTPEPKSGASGAAAQPPTTTDAPSVPPKLPTPPPRVVSPNDSDATDEDLTAQVAEKLGVALPATQLEARLMDLYGTLAASKERGEARDASLGTSTPSLQLPASAAPISATVKAELRKRHQRTRRDLQRAQTVYRARHAAWTARCAELDKAAPVLEAPAPPQVIPDSPRSRGRRARNRGAGDAARSEAEFMEILANLELETARDPLIRSRLTSVQAPPQIFDPAQRLQFKNTNNARMSAQLRPRLAEDAQDTFSPEEHRQFCEAYVQWPKQFGKIAAAMQGFRTFHECVMHYYRTKLEVNYKQLLLKSKPKGRRGRKKKVVVEEPKVLGPAMVIKEVEGESTDGEDGPSKGEEAGASKDAKASEPGTSKAEPTKAPEPVKRGRPAKEPKSAPSSAPSAPSVPSAATVTTAPGAPAAEAPLAPAPIASVPAAAAAAAVAVALTPSASTSTPLATPLATPVKTASTPHTSNILSVLNPAPLPIRSRTPTKPPSSIPPPVQPLGVGAAGGVNANANGSAPAPAAATAPAPAPNGHTAAPTNGIDALATLALKDEVEHKRKVRRRQPSKPTSYWNAAETKKFETLIGVFGSKWDEIARHMEFKSAIMLKNYYQKYRAQRDYEPIVEAADSRIASTGVMPVYVSAEEPKEEDDQGAVAVGAMATEEAAAPSAGLTPATVPPQALPPTGFFAPRAQPLPVQSFKPDENATPPRPFVRPRTSLLASILHDGAELPRPKPGFIEADGYKLGLFQSYRESNERGHE